jgi:hypothetical protein
VVDQPSAALVRLHLPTKNITLVREAGKPFPKSGKNNRGKEFLSRIEREND